MAQEHTLIAHLIYCTLALSLPMHHIKHVTTHCLVLQVYRDSKEQKLRSLCDLQNKGLGDLLQRFSSPPKGQKTLDPPRFLISSRPSDGTYAYRYSTDCKGSQGLRRSPVKTSPTPELPGKWREDVGNGLLITGLPGAGKSHFAKTLVEKLREKGHVVDINSKRHCSVQNIGAGAVTGNRLVNKHARHGVPACKYLVSDDLTQINVTLSFLLGLVKVQGAIFILLGVSTSRLQR